MWFEIKIVSTETLIILIGIVIFFFYLYIVSPRLGGEKRHIRFIYRQMNTGDIVAFDRNTAICVLYKWIFNDNIIHTGVIKREGQKLFVVEAADYGIDPWRGIIKIPLEEWCRINRRKEMLWIPRPDDLPSIDEEIFDNIVDKLLKKKFKTNITFYDFLRMIFPDNISRHGDDEEFFCSKLSAYILQESGGFPKDFSPASYCPKKVKRFYHQEVRFYI